MFHETPSQRTALAGRRALEAPGRLSVAVAPDCARFSLRVGEAGRPAAGVALGLPLPPRIGEASGDGSLLVVCLGPDEWFVLAQSAKSSAIEARFADLAEVHSLVDIGHREVGIEVRGAAAGLALAATCALDLDAMPAGSATRTILDRVQVVLVKYAPDHYRIEVWQSFAPHVWGLLEAAAREIALGL